LKDHQSIKYLYRF